MTIMLYSIKALPYINYVLLGYNIYATLKIVNDTIKLVT